MRSEQVSVSDLAAKPMWRDEADIEPANAAPAMGRRPSFDRVSIGLHWATALAVVAMFATAWLRPQSHDAHARAMLLQIHRSLGVAIWTASAFRLLWRQTKATLPPFPAAMPNVQRSLVRLSECGLYALLLAQPLSGLGMSLLLGHPFPLFMMQVPQLLEEKTELWTAAYRVHDAGALALGALAAGHAVAALVHYFYIRDDALQCMAPVITTAPRPQTIPVRR